MSSPALTPTVVRPTQGAARDVVTWGGLMAAAEQAARRSRRPPPTAQGHGAAESAVVATIVISRIRDLAGWATVPATPGAPPPSWATHYVSALTDWSAAYIDDRTPAPPDASVRSAPGWQRVAELLGAAHDLLATHFDRESQWRSPDASLLAESRLCTLAGLARVTLVAAPALARLLDGFTSDRFGQQHVLLAALLEAADVARELAPRVERISRMSTATPTHSSPSLQSIEVTVSRLRLRAWRLLDAQAPAAAALADFASISAVIANRALAQQVTARQRAAWNTLAMLLSQVCTPTPASRAVRADLALVSHQLTDDRMIEVARPQQLLAALADIARWNSRCFDHAARNHQLYMSARLLSGDEVSDEPILARAKIAGTTVAVPTVRLDAIIAAYATVTGSRSAIR